MNKESVSLTQEEKRTKVLVLTESPPYCDWRNVFAVFLVPIDFNIYADENDFKAHCESTGIGMETTAGFPKPYLSQGKFVDLYCEHLRTRFESLEFDCNNL